MSSGYGNKLTGQIGEYLVCAELGRRGLIATPFAGNVPTFDVLATDEQCRTVPIQVKASRSDNWPTDARHWMEIDLIETDKKKKVQNYTRPVQLQNPGLIYVCVSIALPGGQDRFFILTKAELQTVCVKSYSSFMDKHEWCRPRNAASYDNRYSISGLQEFEDNWQLISDRLQTSIPDQSLTQNEDQPNV